MEKISFESTKDTFGEWCENATARNTEIEILNIDLKSSYDRYYELIRAEWKRIHGFDPEDDGIPENLLDDIQYISNKIGDEQKFYVDHPGETYREARYNEESDRWELKKGDEWVETHLRAHHIPEDTRFIKILGYGDGPDAPIFYRTDSGYEAFTDGGDGATEDDDGYYEDRMRILGF